MSPETVADVRGLTKQYPSFTLSDVSFGLAKGHIAGFIGRNGAGKTTTIKSMLGLVHPDAGDVTYFGMPLDGNEREIRKRIGYAAGSMHPYPRKKIRDLLAVTKTFYPTWDDAACARYLERFEIDPAKTPGELSEGMKVKCNLVAALSHGAELLLLDEPTSGLDPFSRDEILDLFLSLRDSGVSILFSTHITSDLEKCADDILYIRKGKIAARGSKDGFRERYGQSGETLEETVLRLEKEARHA